MQMVTRLGLNRSVGIAPLIIFRIVFGVLMLFSILRFWSKGWINDLYISPKFHFTYYGFDWVEPLGAPGMYYVFFLMAISAFFVAIGFLYRISIILFFLSFTYVELIDKTTYLNHYYFISIIAFLMIFLPANRRLAVDVLLNPKRARYKVPKWTIFVLILQISIVYLYAGLAKINYDWLIEAEPLKTWLKPKYDVPIIGALFREDITHYVMSWFGMLYDCLIPLFLVMASTRKIAYVFVVAFHLFTAILFPIGVFPYAMILLTMIFFSEAWHEKRLTQLERIFRVKSYPESQRYDLKPMFKNLATFVLALHFLIQIVVPWRYLLYPGDLFWTEEGYRFSWRVMLVEKSGVAMFYVKHPDYPGLKPIDNTEFLTPQQIKQMSFQPDMLIQYAHFLKREYAGKTFVEDNHTIQLNNPQICADVYVKLNGKSSRKLIDKSIILSDKQYNLEHRDWLIE